MSGVDEFAISVKPSEPSTETWHYVCHFPCCVHRSLQSWSRRVRRYYPLVRTSRADVKRAADCEQPKAALIWRPIMCTETSFALVREQTHCCQTAWSLRQSSRALRLYLLLLIGIEELGVIRQSLLYNVGSESWAEDWLVICVATKQLYTSISLYMIKMVSQGLVWFGAKVYN